MGVMQFRAFSRTLYLLASALLAVVANAQQFTAAGTTPASGDFVASFVVDVNEVNVFFNVRHGRQLVQGLTSGEFELYEDDRKQNIRFFSSDAQEPLSLAILVDSSTSQSAVLQKQLEVGRKFLDDILVSGDEALVVGFDSLIQIHQDFTSDRDKLANAIVQSARGVVSQSEILDPEPAPKLRSTALYDTIAATGNLRMRDRKGHKAIIIITDGQDMGSRTSFRQAVEAAVRSDSICYVLLVVDNAVKASADYKGIQKMEELTKETGGRLIMAGGKAEKLGNSFSEIAQELRHHYTLAYSPDKKTRNGEYRKIQVKSRHGYRVQARKGYYAGFKKAAEEEARN